MRRIAAAEVRARLPRREELAEAEPPALPLLEEAAIAQKYSSNNQLSSRQDAGDAGQVSTIAWLPSFSSEPIAVFQYVPDCVMMILVLGRPQLLGYMAPISFVKRHMISHGFQPIAVSES